MNSQEQIVYEEIVGKIGIWMIVNPDKVDDFFRIKTETHISEKAQHFMDVFYPEIEDNEIDHVLEQYCEDCFTLVHEFAKCPLCSKRGEVFVRVDAFKNYKIKANGELQLDSISMHDDSRFECFACGQELSSKEVKAVNKIKLNDPKDNDYSIKKQRK